MPGGGARVPIPAPGMVGRRAAAPAVRAPPLRASRRTVASAAPPPRAASDAPPNWHPLPCAALALALATAPMPAGALDSQLVSDAQTPAQAFARQDDSVPVEVGTIRELPGGIAVRDEAIGHGDVVRTGDTVVLRVRGYFREGANNDNEDEYDEYVFLDTGDIGDEAERPIITTAGIESPWMPDRFWDTLAGLRFGGRRSAVLPLAYSNPPRMSGLFGATADDYPLLASPPADKPVLVEVEALRCVDALGNAAEGQSASGRQPERCCADIDFPCGLPEPTDTDTTNDGA